MAFIQFNVVSIPVAYEKIMFDALNSKKYLCVNGESLQVPPVDPAV